MRLLELDPKWILRDGRRVGFVFRNPVRRDRGWWASCFFAPTPHDLQEELLDAALPDATLYQGCNPTAGWSVVNGTPETASFETISITPSLDGGPNFWHGYITNGEIVGGLPA